MAKGKLTINSNKNLGLMLKTDTKIKSIITVAEFFETHKIFMSDKSLEGLRKSTIDKHIEQIKYFKTFLEQKYQSYINCVADEGLNSGTFKEYCLLFKATCQSISKNACMVGKNIHEQGIGQRVFRQGKKLTPYNS